MARIDAVIFDMDGVLVDTEMLNVELLEQFLEQRTGKLLPRSVTFPLVGATGDMFWNPIKAYLGMDVETKDIDAENEAFVSACDISYKAYEMPHAREILDIVRGMGFKLALATSSEGPRARDITTKCGLGGFDVVMTGDMFTLRKPDPEIYLTTAAKLGVAPERCVAVEDSVFGIEAASRAGMTVIARRETRFGGDQGRADYIVNDLLEVADILKKIS